MEVISKELEISFVGILYMGPKSRKVACSTVSKTTPYKRKKACSDGASRYGSTKCNRILSKPSGLLQAEECDELGAAGFEFCCSIRKWHNDCFLRFAQFAVIAPTKCLPTYSR